MPTLVPPAYAFRWEPLREGRRIVYCFRCGQRCYTVLDDAEYACTDCAAWDGTFDPACLRGQPLIVLRAIVEAFALARARRRG